MYKVTNAKAIEESLISMGAAYRDRHQAWIVQDWAYETLMRYKKYAPEMNVEFISLEDVEKKTVTEKKSQSMIWILLATVGAMGGGFYYLITHFSR